MADIVQPEFSDELRNLIQSLERYEGFKLLDHPVLLKDLFANIDVEYVQLHSTQMISGKDYKSIVGFCGVFQWTDNQIKSLDGDSYTSEVFVYGYKWFVNEGERCLDVLVGEDW